VHIKAIVCADVVLTEQWVESDRV